VRGGIAEEEGGNLKMGLFSGGKFLGWGGEGDGEARKEGGGGSWNLVAVENAAELARKGRGKANGKK